MARRRRRETISGDDRDSLHHALMQGAVGALSAKSTSPPAPLPSPARPSPGEGRTAGNNESRLYSCFILNFSPLPAGGVGGRWERGRG